MVNDTDGTELQGRLLTRHKSKTSASTTHPDWRLGLAGITEMELSDRSKVGRLRLISKLRRALRQERQRGISGHWAYSLGRHKALLDAYRSEVRCYRSQSNMIGPKPGA